MYNTNNQLIELLTADNLALTSTACEFTKINNQITTLISKLNTSLTTLENGTSTMASGSLSLNSALEVLSSKSIELADGINEFNEQGINKLSTIADSANNVTNKIEALIKLSDEYQSFSLTNINTQSNTKFIVVIDSQKVKEEKVVVKNDKTKDNFFARLKNLFK